MEVTPKQEQDDGPWTGEMVGKIEPGYPEPIFVTMPNDLMDDQVEIQEVVIVTEGGEQTTEVDEIPFTPKMGEETEVQEVAEQYDYHTLPSSSGMQYYFNQPVKKRGRPKFKKYSPVMDPTPKFQKLEQAMMPVTPLQGYSTMDMESDSDGDQDTSDLNHELGMLRPRSMSRKKPKPREFAHRLQWRNRDMLEAMKAVEEQKMTIRGAAKRFSVPYSTLKDRVHGRVRHGTKPGVKTILSPEEEEELVRFIREMENAGFQLRCVDVRDRAAELLRLNHGHNSPYKEGSPGHNWFHGFVKRHPGLEFKRTLKKNIVPSISKQKHMLRRFYDITAGIYKKYKLSHKADRIFSVAELRLGGQFQCTVLYATSAAGHMIPPFVVFRGLSVKLTAARSEFPDAFFTCSPDGLINEDIFLWWFRDHFLKKIPSSHMRPGVLFISRGVQDLTMQLLQIAKDDRMSLIGMPFGISHLVQPLDDDVTDGILRTSFDKKFQKWTEENPGAPVTQKVVAMVLRKVWSKVQPEEIAGKFTGNGIYPLNAYAITQDKLLTGAHVLREIVEQGGPDRRDLPCSSNQNLSGLNLLSALSSHAYASLDYFNPHESVASNEQSNDSASEDSTPELPPDPHATGVDYKFFKSEGTYATVVPMSEVEAEVQEQVEIVCETGNEIDVASEPTREQAEHLLELRRELTKRRPRPASDIFTRQSDVQSEINQAKDNVEQINKAIDSILDDSKQPDQSTSQQKKYTTGGLSQSNSTLATGVNSPQIIALKSGRTSTTTTTVSSAGPRVIRIAPEQIKQELSRALKNVTSDASPCTLKLADPTGKDIKIHVRIRGEEEDTPEAAQHVPRSHSPPGRFIRLDGSLHGGQSRQNVVIQSSQIRSAGPRGSSNRTITSTGGNYSTRQPKVITLRGANANGIDYTEEPQQNQVMKEVMTPHGPVMVIEPSVGGSETVVDGVVSSDGIGEEVVTVEEQVYQPSPGEELQDCIIQYVDELGQVVEEEIVATTS